MPEGAAKAIPRRRRSEARDAGREEAATPRATAGRGDEAEQRATAEAQGPERRPRLMDVPGAASEIVQRAAAILGDEIAAGIVAAKQVEERFIKPGGQVVEQAPQEMMQRFRKDAHEVVDILMDLLTSITDTLGSLVDQANGAAASAATAAAAANGGQRAIQLRVGAGETARRAIRIQRADDGDAARFFACTDFVAGSGERLPASCVSFDGPGEAAASGEDGKVEVRVEVPDGAPVGLYSGLLRWGPNGKHRTVMELLVDQAP